MTKIENYYAYLGISEDSSVQVIRRAYRQKSLKVHPDKLKVDDTDEFNKLKCIYDILSDKDKKAAYDKQLDVVRQQEKIELELSEKQRRYREKFRQQEEEAQRKKDESAKSRYSKLRREQIMRQDAVDVMIFDREMQAKRRKRMENIIKAATQPKQEESDTEYTEDEVMKMMGL